MGQVGGNDDYLYFNCMEREINIQITQQQQVDYTVVNLKSYIIYIR